MESSTLAAKERWTTKYGEWAVITGASDGIGRAFATELATRKLNLVLVARRKAILIQLADELAKQYSVLTQVIEADLSLDVGNVAVMTATQNLPVGLFVACAGFGTSGQFIDLPIDRELRLLDVNCRSALTLSHHFGERFARQKHGGIILMSSLVAFQGVARSANYAATKAYIQSLAEGLHTELSHLGVDVLASAPGPVHSGFASQADMQMQLAAKPAEIARGTLNALGKKVTVRPDCLSHK